MRNYPSSSPRKTGMGRVAIATLLSTLVTVSEAAILNLTDAPVYLLASVEPNVLLTFDDSGSMARSFIPDEISGEPNNKRACSSAFNRIYYDPTITYDPPVREDGTPLNAVATSFTAAYINGFNTAAGTVNLATSFRPSWYNATDFGTAACGFTSATATTNTEDGGNYTSGRAAFYFTYSTACGNVNNNACYTLVQHNNAAAGGAWNATQQQNFANWYSYYRNRNMMAKTAAGRAFSRFGSNVRVTAQHLGPNAGTATGANNGSACTAATCFTANFSLASLTPFTGAARTTFFSKLYNSPTSNWTPLREAMYRAGEFVRTSDDPYRDNPSAGVGSPVRSCRANLHVLMTDGYWNAPNGTNAGTIINTNSDNTGAVIPTDNSDPVQNTTVSNYTSRPPYADGHTGTLADAAFYYWITDLRPGLTNNVPSRLNNRTGPYSTYFWYPENDPATWQHLSTFTIGLGIDGVLTNNTATYNNLVSGATAWPDPCTANPGSGVVACQNARIDDLWHAAINSRGRYFSAKNPSDLVNAFTAIVSDVNDRISAASSVAMNSGTLTANNYVYQARFNSGDWSGQLLAYPIDPATGNLGSVAWDAASVLTTQNYDTGRQILTYKPSTGQGTAFRWANLDASQQALLNYNTMTAATDALGSARLNWIRGDASNEGTFRVRERLCGVSPCPAGTNTGWLGDTVDSAPVFVGAPPFSYPDSLESSPYSAYKTSKQARTPVIYVGANDGMLHGFNASNGREVMAYVPGPVYPNLSGLTAPVYAHKYFVNGSPTMGDAYVGGQWRTVLAGGLRKGGQGVYALDVSTPENLTEGNAGTTVLWEFNDTHDADLGYVYGEVAIARMANGRWAVIFGNGYNNTDTSAPPYSTTGNAVLYIAFIENGMDGNWLVSDFVKIDTGVGNNAAASPNGLAGPAIVDVNGDYIVDYIYAGDLRGNLWRFDVRSANSSDWASVGNRKIVFSAGPNQPITSRPVVGRHPAGYRGVMAYFGTGKYLESSDASTVGAATQTFYGIWDDLSSGGPAVPAASLLTQSVVASTSNYRVISDLPLDWSIYRGWRLNMPTTGERIVANPLLFNGIAIFTTIIPSDDPCAAGGTGWLMEINAANGGQLAVSPFDTNGDGVINNADLLAVPGGGTGAAGGVRFGGIPSMPAIISGGNPYGASANACAGGDCKYISTSSGGVEKIDESSDKTTTWRQVR